MESTRYNAARHAGRVQVARLDDVLEVLDGYTGLLIVDCKDSREGAHAALAQLLRDRGLVGTVIARTASGASELKAVDRRFRTIVVADEVLHPDVDAWIAEAENIWPGHSTLADLAGDLGMYVHDDHWPRDEGPLLDDGRRHGVGFVISNDVAGALRWRSGAEGTSSTIARHP